MMIRIGRKRINHIRFGISQIDFGLIDFGSSVSVGKTNESCVLDKPKKRNRKKTVGCCSCWMRCLDGRIEIGWNMFMLVVVIFLSTDFCPERDQDERVPKPNWANCRGSAAACVWVAAAQTAATRSVQAFRSTPKSEDPRIWCPDLTNELAL